jgi:hypothetical protein
MLIEQLTRVNYEKFIIRESSSFRQDRRMRPAKVRLFVIVLAFLVSPLVRAPASIYSGLDKLSHRDAICHPFMTLEE